jgi:CheY-like chemotaxis protein
MEGVSLPRILVADDNSNIHRTIALALKDAGVEVVAVGNGEAAVRKIAEIKPDLVLADIFMPVRNGYEVCEFVKHDPRFSSIPVVLLIGAFDPFDEREAQKVQADGILKKPFVPPDALLRTVTDLLAQSAARTSLVPVAASVAKSEASAAAETHPGGYMDQAPEEITPPKAKIEWNVNEQPVAFGSLLETPADDVEEPVVTAHRDPTLGEPAFWAPTPTEQPQDETEEEAAQADHGLVDLEQWGSAAKELDLPSGEPRHIAAIESAVVEAEPEPELTQPAAAASQPAEALSETLSELPEPVPEPAMLELPPAHELPQLPAHDSLPEIPSFAAPAAEEKAEPEEELVHDIKDFTWAVPSYASGEATEGSTPKQDAAPAPKRDAAPKLEEEPLEPASVSFETFAPFLATLASATAAHVTEAGETLKIDPLPASPADSPAPLQAPKPVGRVDPSAAPRLDPAAIEAVAQRVIERMQPQIIDLVTRELLRPVVEALVQRELEKK